MPGTPARSGGNRQVGGDPTPDDGGPIKPITLTESASSKWDDLLGQLPSGILRKVDCHQLGLLAELLAQAEQLAALIANDPADEKSRRLYLGTCDRITRLSPAFGLSPTDRRRAKLETEKPDPSGDAFAQWIKKARR